MEGHEQTEDRFRASVEGDKHFTNIEVRVPTFWIWVVFALTLATQFPDLWKLLQEILPNGTP